MGVWIKRLLRLKRNVEMENFIRHQLGRVKTRILDEEYYPTLFNPVERLATFVTRLLSW